MLVSHLQCQEPGERRIFLARCLVADDGDLTITRRRHQRADAAPLEKAENAFARTLVGGLDVLLGRCRRRVEHETLAVAIRSVQAVEENGVNVRVVVSVAGMCTQIWPMVLLRFLVSSFIVLLVVVTHRATP